jgi:hypothetical protein
MDGWDINRGMATPAPVLAFGPHVNRDARTALPLVAGLRAAIDTATRSGVRLGAWAAFVSGPRGGPIALRAGEAAELRAAIAAGRAPPLFAHAAYTTSLGAADGAQLGRHASLGEQLAAVAECGGAGLVVHLPKDSPAGAAARVAAALHAAGVTGEAGPRVYLETPAFVPTKRTAPGAPQGAPQGTSQGTSQGTPQGTSLHTSPGGDSAPWAAPAIGVATFADPAGLAELWRELAAAGAPMSRLGLCVDTAHVWTGGVCLRWRAPAAAYCAALDGVVAAIADGPTPRVLLHLNDSARARGSGPDHHAPLGLGQIWGGAVDGAARPDGLAEIVGWAAAHGFPTILERNDDHGHGHDVLSGDYAVLARIK